MEFFVNDIKHRIDLIEPGMTLLRYLRTEASLKGTKEGCASGDCGACTVLVASEKGEARSVNSCISLLGSFSGERVYTVDGLAKPKADSDQKTALSVELHPVQKAMVDCHGSQCGFCTPGFVMSLAGLYQNHLNQNDSQNDAKAQNLSDVEKAEIKNDDILDAVSGNLCRCTGYRPILDAAKTMMSYEATPVFTAVNEESSSSFENSNNFGSKSDSEETYFLPETESELQSLLSRYPDAFLLSGGTDKVLEISQQYANPAVVIDITRVDELKSVTSLCDHILIGASASYSDVEALFEVKDGSQTSGSEELIGLLHRLGSRQIRNRGSFGGNIANGSPIADTPPVLMAWNADIEVVDTENHRRWVGINEFYLGYRKTVLNKGEYIAQIRIAKDEISKPHAFYKVSKRFEDDISAVMGAFVIATEGPRLSTVRLAYGGMAATPVRAKKTEAFLLGKEWHHNKQIINKQWLDSASEILASEFTPMSDVRASAEYRKEIAVNLFKKAFARLAADFYVEAVFPKNPSDDVDNGVTPNA